MEGHHSGLTRLQRSAGEAFFSLPESAGFLLAGGGALIAQGLVARTTEDLDLFATRGRGDVAAASAALLALADDRGWTAEITRTGPEFRRIVIEADVGAGVEEVQIELCVDSPPTGVPTATLVGPSFAPFDLAVRKTLALFSRAEARDFTDVYALTQKFDRADVLDAAKAADLGFDLTVFSQMLRAHRRLGDDEFPDAGQPVESIRAYFNQWADDLQSQPQS